ncbi:MAG: SAM-dependent methyltransferase, partial [Phenylobacterium zucineum]
MNPDLPLALRQGIDRLLHGIGRSDLAARSSALSEGYRAGRASKVVIRTAEDACAYATARLPATYAA